MKQYDLFNDEITQYPKDWEKEWIDMPEYVNDKVLIPKITATFKFRNKEDFDLFMEVVKTNLYDNKRVFDGKQKLNEYTAWYPLDSRPSEHIYIVKDEK